MRWVFWVALLFAAAVGLALFTELNLSNVVLFYRPHSDGIALVRVLSRYRDLDSAGFEP